MSNQGETTLYDDTKHEVVLLSVYSFMNGNSAANIFVVVVGRAPVDCNMYLEFKRSRGGSGALNSLVCLAR